MRNIDLLTISSHDHKMDVEESAVNDYMFPMRDIEPRAKRFKSNKPIVLLTARVHPGETPASHSINGVIKFLLDKKYFVFMIIPMINPDGVANGHYRMDIYNQNLNRHYKNPDPQKQPMILAIKELVQYLSNENRLFFYCDFHSHAAKKGCFFFGNALDYVMQTESMLFAKVMSLNCINFEFDSCNFSKKHMFARDRGEKLTKEGAGRVCVYKISNIIHSYTLECGFHFSNILNKLSAPKNPSSFIQKQGFACKENDFTNIESDIYKETPTYYTIEMFEDIGKAMMVSILDIFEKNPCSRIVNTQYGNMETLRRELAKDTSKITRFKRDLAVTRKCKRINELAKEVFYDDFAKKNCFQREKHSSSLAPMERGRKDNNDREKQKNFSLTPNNKDRNDSLSLPSSSDPDDDFNSSDEEQSLSPPPPKKNIDFGRKTPIPPGKTNSFRPMSSMYSRATPSSIEKDTNEFRMESMYGKSFLGVDKYEKLDIRPDPKMTPPPDKLAHLKMINRARMNKNSGSIDHSQTGKQIQKKVVVERFAQSGVYRIMDRGMYQRQDHDKTRIKQFNSKLPILPNKSQGDPLTKMVFGKSEKSSIKTKPMARESFYQSAIVKHSSDDIFT